VGIVDHIDHTLTISDDPFFSRFRLYLHVGWQNCREISHPERRGEEEGKKEKEERRRKEEEGYNWVG